MSGDETKVKPNQAPQLDEVEPDPSLEGEPQRDEEYDSAEEIDDEPVRGRTIPPVGSNDVPKIILKPKATQPPWMSPEPLVSPGRKPQDVTNGLRNRSLANSPMELFKQQLAEMDNLYYDQQEEQYRMYAVLYLKTFIFPFIDEIAKVAKITPEEQLRRMIRDRRTLGSLASGGVMEALDSMMRTPQVRFALNLVRPFADMTDDEVRNQGLWWMDRIKESRIGLYNVLASDGNGLWWLKESLVDCMSVIRGAI